jgi:hypothetical protein
VRGELRRAAHFLPARHGPRSAFARATADKIALGLPEDWGCGRRRDSFVSVL